MKLSQPDFFFLRKIFFILFFLSIQFNHAQSTNRPNVILIMTDDQGYGDIAIHGNPIIKTPNLDTLYSESIRFTDFHVNAFCAPTRAALMTGRMSDRTHVRSTVYLRNHLNKEETTMAEFFKESGYKTALFGKWHLGQNYPYRPIDRGFQKWVGHGDGGTGTASDYWSNDKMNDHYMRNGKWEEFHGYGNDNFFNETKKFISKNMNNPFFIYLATNIPHLPWNVKKEWTNMYSNIDKSSPDWESEVDFMATITRFDKNLGDLRTFLKKNNLDENTIIIFLSDNGTSGGHKIFNAGMRGKKGSMFDGGHRVPLMIHWPKGNMTPKKDVSKFTSHIDILPTLIDLCDLKTPKKGHLKFDGRSLIPLLNNSSFNWEDRTLFQHYQNTEETYIKWKNSLVYTSNWRLINGAELYNIKKDPSQKENLADQYPQIVDSLRKEYDSFWNEVKVMDQPYPRPIVGTEYDLETVLTSDAWVLKKSTPPTWNQTHILRAANNSGFWPIKIAEKANYIFEIRRWAKEINHPISESLPKSKQGDIYNKGNLVLLGEGIAIPAVKVQLQIGNKTYTKQISSSDTSSVFNLPLQEGNTMIKAWLIDKEGNKYPAYYVYIKKGEIS